MRRSTVAFATAVVLVAIAPVPVTAAVITYDAVLRGASVVSDGGEPTPGDPDGFAHYGFDVDPATGELCTSSNIIDLDSPTGARVHAGTAGSNGPAVMELPTPPAGESEVVCTTVDPELVAPLVADPNSFYVLVTTDEYPDGAIRGQLSLQMCHLAGWGPEQVEGSETPVVYEGETVEISGFYPAGGHVTLTVDHDGVLVSSEVREIPPATWIDLGVLHLELSFAEGDDGVWIVHADDPAVGDCSSSVEIRVQDLLGAGPSGAAGATTGGSMLPDTAMAPPMGPRQPAR